LRGHRRVIIRARRSIEHSNYLSGGITVPATPQPKSKHKLHWAVIAAASAVAVAPAHHASAATRTWDGGGVDDNVNTAANWVNDTLPILNGANNATTDDWVFTGTTRLTPNINVNPAQLLNSITFDANAGAFTITNSAASTMQIGNTGGGGGNIINNSPNVQTFTTGIAPRAGAITANTADIVINGLFNVGNDSVVDRRTNTFNGSANVTLNGQLTGFGKITKSGNGTLFLTNDANDFQGTLTINNGAVRISVAHGLGQFNTAGGTGGATLIAGNVGGDGRLELTGDITTVAEPMRLDARQGASATAPHILNISGNNTLTGPISYNTGGSEYTPSSPPPESSSSPATSPTPPASPAACATSISTARATAK
jgi:autotransporter-associated beta strand protein